MRAILTATVALCLAALPGTAGGATFPLDWSERHARYVRHLVLTYSVEEVTIGKGRWRARVRVRNETNLRIRFGTTSAVILPNHRITHVTVSPPRPPRGWTSPPGTPASR